MTLKSAIVYFRISLAIIYIWFGMLKFFPGLSPAEDLAWRTITQLFGHTLSSQISLKLLAGWEVLIGVGLTIGKPMKFWARLAMIHIFFTFTPLFILPEFCFTSAPFALTLIGQYIIKNLIFVGVLILFEKGES